MTTGSGPTGGNSTRHRSRGVPGTGPLGSSARRRSSPAFAGRITLRFRFANEKQFEFLNSNYISRPAPLRRPNAPGSQLTTASRVVVSCVAGSRSPLPLASESKRPCFPNRSALAFESNRIESNRSARRDIGSEWDVAVLFWGVAVAFVGEEGEVAGQTFA